jgi:formate hydrogenlyase subunit 4
MQATVLNGLEQIALFALIAPALVGFQQWLQARLQLRKGPPLWQPYLNLFKLLRIQAGLRPETTSWVYAIAPPVAFVCYALLSWATPPFSLAYLPLDFLTVIYLLGLARFMLALAGMDTGTSLGGMGSSREMFINVLAEPLLILIVLILAFQHGTTNMMGIISRFSSSSGRSGLVFDLAALLLLWLALAFVALMDNGLLPIDNPSTHLELTMIQKAIHLEYSGRKLALIEWGEAMRLTFFLTLLGDLLIPRNTTTLPGVLTGIGLPLLYIIKLLVAASLLALFEITQIKLRLRRVVTPWVVALLLVIAAVFLAAGSLVSVQ